jgi:hypothetical protein
LASLFRSERWRLLLYPTIITYILLVSPLMGRTDREVSASLRRLIPDDRDETDRLQRLLPNPGLAREILAIAVGLALGGLVLVRDRYEGGFSWLVLCWISEAIMMYGLLSWTVYLSLTSARQIGQLYRQPLRVDPFDIEPFEPIGKQALLLALVFVGGITIGLLFAGIQPTSLRQPEFWLAYLPPALMPVVVFFLIMLPTHRVFAAAKARELKGVRRQMVECSRALARAIDSGHDSQRPSQQVLALAAYEQQLERARTWPYNIGMLRTLFFSVLVPAATFLARLVGDVEYP